MPRRNATAPQRVLSVPFRALTLCACFFLTLAAHAATDTVTTLADTGAGSLRAEIAAAAANDTIVFQNGLSGTITLASTLTISKNLTIQGPGANVITISGNNAVGVSEITSGTVTISGLTIANGNASGGGGGIFMDVSTTLTVNGVTFSGNTTTAGNGGGIENSQGTLTVTNSTFSGNSAVTLGGAIENSNSTLTVTNSTFSGNSADTGGAINNLSSTATISNSTFSGNSATFGGAINNQVNTLTVSNSIFTGNSAAEGGGISNFATANIGNSVFYNNPAASGPDCRSCTSNTNEVTTDPKLLPLGYYGGATQTMLSQPGSSAICAGSSSLVPGGTTTDQRGFFLGFVCANGGVDAGAVQSDYAVVGTLADTTHTLCALSTCSLRDLIVGNGIDIDFDPSLTSTSHPGTITLGSALPAITGTVNIVGPGANQLSISGGGSTTVGSVLTVNSGAQVFLYGLTIANGNSQSSDGGGGIDNEGTLTVMASAVANNSTNNGGGGINNYGTLTVTGSTISGNADSSGNGGGIFSNHVLTVTESTIYGNTSSSSDGPNGGGIDSPNGTLTLIGSTVTGNSAVCIPCSSGAAVGGGIYVNNKPVLANSIAAGNSASGGFDADIYDFGHGYTDNGGNVADDNSSDTSPYASTLHLSQLQYNGIGATVQTVIPLPGSPAICAGSKANIPSGTTTDERGYPNTNSTYTGYSSGSPCVDAGAVQTNYTSTAFVQQPTNTLVSTVITPSPTAEVLETDTLLSSNNTDAVSGIPVTLTLATGGGTLGGTLTQTTSGGVATFGNLTVSALGASDELATNAITVVGTDILAAQDSSTFEVIGPVTQFGLSATSPVAIGGTSSVIVAAQDVNDNTNTAYRGTVRFTSTDLAAGLPGNYTFTSGDNGQHTFSVTMNTVGSSQTVTVTDTTTPSITGTSNTITVNPAVTATTVIPSKGLAVLNAVSPFTPVTGSNGVAPLHYSISPTLPPALTISSTTGAISGLPTITDGGNTYTVTVTDFNGATATATFFLAINGHVTATTTFAETNLTQNHAATSFIPVTGSGGTTPLSYSVLPPLPTGLSISSSTGFITGTPTITSPDIIYTVTVTDANGATAHNTFSLGVNSAVTATQAVPTTSLTVLSAATSFTPVTGGGGTVSLSYGVSPTLPTGLSMSSSNGAITGTPTVISAATGYTVTVTDTNGATATNTFTLTVNQASQTINFTAPATPVTYGVSPISLSATATSSLTVAFTVASGPCTIASGATTVSITGVGSCVINANQAGNTNFTAAAQVQKTIVVNQAAVSITTSPVTQSFGSFSSGTVTVNGVSGGTVPTGSLSYSIDSGTPTTETLSAGQGPYSIPSLTGGSHTLSLSYGGDTTYTATSTPTVVNFTVTKASTTVALVQAVPTTSGVGTGVSTTFTSTVTGFLGAAIPTGSVQFFDGSTPLGTGSLTAGVAAVTTTFSTTGTHLITAVYSGDGNYTTSTSATFNEVVGTPGFTVGSNPASLTIARGSNGTATLTFTPTGNYTGTVTLNCSGLPAFTACQFTPSSLTFTGNNVAQTSQLTVFTLNASAVPGASASGLLWLPAGLLVCFVALRRRRLGRLRPLLMLAIAVFALAAMTGCGGGTFITPTGSNTVTITATGTNGATTTTQTAVLTVTITQ